MKIRRILLIALALISLVGVGSTAYQVGEFPRLLEVKALRQARVTSCGEAVITMAYNYANPETTMQEQEVIEFAARQGYYTEKRWPYTSPANMVDIARHYAPVLRTGWVQTREHGLALLVEQLREGEAVIIDVPLRLEDVDSVPHFILVTGISRDAQREGAIMIHYNEPLTGDKKVSPWDGEAGIWNGWINNQDPGGPGWWLVIPPP
jgi:hypothetical protein